MKPWLIAFSLVGFSTAVPAIATPVDAASYSLAEAQEGFEGEVEVTLKNTAYLKVEVNGQPYDAVEFGTNGKLAIIRGLNLQADETAITLIPTDSSLAPYSFTVLKSDLKQKRKGRILRFVATKTVTFEKSSEVTPGKPTEQPAQPNEPVVPPVQPNDDL